jgi:hypothetical protein
LSVLLRAADRLLELTDRGVALAQAIKELDPHRLAKPRKR